MFGFHTDDAAADVEVRSFAPADGVPEDPVCGSGNGCVAVMIQREKLLARNSYVSSQGTACTAMDALTSASKTARCGSAGTQSPASKAR